VVTSACGFIISAPLIRIGSRLIDLHPSLG